MYKYGTYQNYLDIRRIRNGICLGWYDNVLRVIIDDTAYFLPQVAIWRNRPEFEWKITATNNRIDLLQFIHFDLFYPGINL